MTDEELLEVAQALGRYLLHAERVLAAASLHDPTSPWREFVVMSEHRFARVALMEDYEPKVVLVPYAEVRSSSWLPLVEFWTVRGERVVFGRLANATDVEQLEAAMWNLTVPDLSERPTALAFDHEH